MKKVIVITAIGILVVIAPQTQAALIIEIAVEAEVTGISDDYNLLEGNVNVGDTITGSYKYDSDTPDSSPADPIQGNYWHYTNPYGVSLSVGGFEFKTDPSAVNFEMYVRNNNPLKDIYGFSSYNNIPLSNGIPSGTISWQLDDDSATALIDDSLPLISPTLEEWNFNHLFIEGGERFGDFIINGEVTSVILIPEPASIIIFSLGFLCMKKIKSKTKQ